MSTTQYPPATPQGAPPGNYYPQYPPQQPPPQQVAPQPHRSYKKPALLAAAGVAIAGISVGATLLLTGTSGTSTPTITPGPQQLASQFIGETAADGSHITSAVPVPKTETNGGGNTAEQINATFSDGTHYRLVIVLHNGEKLFKSLYQQ